MVWLRGFYIHPKGRCSGRGQQNFADTWVSFAGVTVLLLFKSDGFEAQTPEYSLGFKDCERAIISSDLKKILGFRFSGFGDHFYHTIIHLMVSLFVSHLCILTYTAYIFV